MSLIEKVFAAHTEVETDSIGNIFKLGNGVTNGFTSVETAVGTILGWFLWLAGILAFAYLVYAGILYITANGNDEQAKKGQKGIINAVIGIIVIALAYTIINVVLNLVGGSTS